MHNRAMPQSEHEGTAELVAADGVELLVRRYGNPALPMLIVVHGGLESMRSRQTFTEYRRFLTAGRIVK